MNSRPVQAQQLILVDGCKARFGGPALADVLDEAVEVGLLQVLLELLQQRCQPVFVLKKRINLTLGSGSTAEVKTSDGTKEG